MSSMTFAPNGGTVGALDLPGWFKRVGKRQGPTTTVITEGVAKEIAAVIRAWDEGNLSATLPLPFPADAAAAVRFIRDHLGVTLPEVEAAVGVTDKSYHNWAGKGHKPQQRSLGILWPMTYAVYSLACAHPNLAAWYHSSSAAQKAFLAGNINGLLLAEMDWAVRAADTQPLPAVEFDAELPTDDVPARPRRRRVSAEVAPATRRKRVTSDGV